MRPGQAAPVFAPGLGRGGQSGFASMRPGQAAPVFGADSDFCKVRIFGLQ